MISIDHIRNLEPSLRTASDKEIEEIREKLYELAKLCIETYEDDYGSKIPLGFEDEIYGD